MNPDTKQHKRGGLKPIALFLAVIGLVVIAEVVLINDYLAASRENRKWTEERIAQSLGLSIPEDAANVRFDGAWAGYARYLTLDFEASPSTLGSFASHFCNGVLHSGYDPYNDIEVARSIDSPYTVLIEYIYNFQVPPVITRFYAYSPITSELDFAHSSSIRQGGDERVKKGFRNFEQMGFVLGYSKSRISRPE